MEKTKLKCWDWQKRHKGEGSRRIHKGYMIIYSGSKNSKNGVNEFSLTSFSCLHFLHILRWQISFLSRCTSIKKQFAVLHKVATQKITCCFNGEHQPNNPSIIHHFTKLTLEHNSQHNSHPWFSDNSATSQSNINQLLTHVVSLHFQYNIH